MTLIEQFIADQQKKQAAPAQAAPFKLTVPQRQRFVNELLSFFLILGRSGGPPQWYEQLIINHINENVNYQDPNFDIFVNHMKSIIDKIINI